MNPPWVLALQPPTGDPARRVGGLSLALRLALDAQRAGATAIVVQDDRVAALLADERLTVPVVAEAPSAAAVLSVPADTVVHRDAFRTKLTEDGSLSLDEASARPPYGFSPIRVVDAVSARRAERALFRALRKPQDGWTSRYLNRYISLSVSRWLVKTPLTPNQVSVGILGIGLSGAWLASAGTYASLLAGAFLFQMQSILDGCDGEMSRITYRGSLLGEWLDTIGDDLTNYGFFGAAAFGLYQQSGSAVYAASGMVTIACGVTVSAIEYRYLIRIGSGDLLKYPLSQSSSSEGPFAKIAPLFKRDTFVFLTLVAAVLGAVGPMLVVFSIGAVGILAGVVLAEVRMAREPTS